MRTVHDIIYIQHAFHPTANKCNAGKKSLINSENRYLKSYNHLAKAAQETFRFLFLNFEITQQTVHQFFLCNVVALKFFSNTFQDS